MKKLIVCVVSFCAAQAAFSAGFGLYEASARGNALGGTLVGSTRDASAVYYNPANVTETTNVSVMVGATMVGVYSDVKVDHEKQTRMNPGLFCIPHFFLTVPLPFDFAVGWGNYCENGLGTKYGDGWDLAGDTIETTLEQFTMGPTLSYKITDWWSVGAGMRISYIYFDSKKNPYADAYVPGMGNIAHLSSELEGDDWSMGYVAGTSFKLPAGFSLGLVYRSPIRHDINGEFDVDGKLAGNRYARDSDASAKLNLPQSVTGGLNWDVTDDWRLGFALTWTEWSSVDNIHFNIPAANGGYVQPLRWKDVWRVGLGTEYDLFDDRITLRAGYVYDMDPSSRHYGTTMLPSGHRSIMGLGIGWRIWDTLRLDIGYNLVFMASGSRMIHTDNSALRAQGLPVEDGSYDFKTYNSRSHMLAATLSYEF